ncbi:bifunctional (p)ppGpp synthetase/guanosine-3',5'-bis(diphosphate) 3'-pyrophosphohydrolase [Selenomonadales bacterium OttesenSCG-928-I06]|nr:bifunctional (p)ppGpp synthetase/guanosine-3',5'-bis(diphosphate) 3'-pyrophosphohydrolase [Selenomonadales bacterium OttesenSCG-928-I06]
MSVDLFDKEPNEIIEEIINNIKAYQNDDTAIAMVRKAYEYALNAHNDQIRKSGEKYICHPLGVAHILTTLQVDATTVTAALLHDVVEDSEASLKDIEDAFTPEVAMLVDGVTKLSKMQYTSKEERQIESYRKMFLAMARDIRVVLIKLADRLHNMRTLHWMDHHKQLEIARETMEIFAPLANRLGISNVKCELEDLAFSYFEPEEYFDLVDQLNKRSEEREKIITDAKEFIAKNLEENGIKATIQGRAKHLYSIHKKMKKNHKTDVNEIYDIFAIRVIVNDVKDCYEVLGIIHSLTKPLPGRFKDYIAMPKSNMYQSLHTTVITKSGQPIEIQIRTYEMHQISEYGIAAHWLYKETGKSSGKGFDQKLSWLRQLLDWHKDIGDTQEFVDTIKLDVFADEVFVFTPKGDVIDLPAGSVPIDFAYRIHTEIGHRCVGARVNRKIVPLEYKLVNGDIVEIITTKHPTGPSRDWLNIVGASETRSKIRQWFKKEKREENIVKGREMVEKECKKLGYDWKSLIGDGNRLSDVAKRLSISGEDDLLASIGYGGVSLHSVMTKLIEAHNKEVQQVTPPTMSEILKELKPKHPKQKVNHGILVKGESGLTVRLAKCCNPLPGDMIVGYITKGRGVSVHRSDCLNILNNKEEFERIIEVNWNLSEDDLYQVSIEIIGLDRPNLVADVSIVFADAKIKVSSINAKLQKNDTVVMLIDIYIANLTQLEFIMSKIRRIKDIMNVHRTSQSVV